VRLFIAVWPPDDVLDAVEELPRPKLVGCRWTTRDQWHVTLRFLGEMADDELPTVVAALEGIAVDPVTATMGPAVELLNPRIVSVPVAGLESVGPAVITATASLGRPPEDRPFRGHLTLARLTGVRKRDLGPAIEAPIDETWPVEEVHVVRSFLSPKGARYETVAVVPLD
jgi:RNA 2',3'-cyclic 3'-phosphodiesterase